MYLYKGAMVKQMKEYLSVLEKCSIFNGMKSEYIETIISDKNYKVINYDKGDIIALEDNICEYVGIVLTGSIEIQKIYESGRFIVMQRFNESNTFGEAIVFSLTNNYPYTIISSVKSEIMLIPNKSIIELCSKDEKFLSNFMSLLSEKILILNQKVKTISFCSVRQKLANFILEQVQIQNREKIKLSINKKELSEYLGVQRTSLSRELINMQDDGILECSKNEIKVLDMYTLKEIMCK